MYPLQDFEPLLWPFIVLMWLVVSMYSRAALHRRWRARSHPAPRRPHVQAAAPALPKSLRLRWDQARERYGRVAGEYGQYEADALQVLRLPALADPAVPSTGRFIDAFHEAMALHTEEFPPEPMARQFIEATVTAEKAWAAAREAAEKLRASRFTAEERALIAQGIKLLELAQGGATPAEQEAALGAARGVLAKLERSVGTRLDWRVPRSARQAIDAAGKPRLPPA
ncbi:hypothetical protein LWP59_15655 [Amycolatopsis acidiphila]|uniref:Uncharacterized protein n=1 Tax=Amycolatopsis acidiphila TaxID=715473 RepID=A0A557ZZ27_9PSEU|nr:hypothetical protein [Amycolatopsis acidiphila]TVT17262.1 hypothetical protein FNH06_32195 [Amycolatopsis acidiphila]UIJ62953.1 hypothetical protein LWP59_15655 [Amycolatopsis acidiphila]GHG65258.1 hypothetical protein GCM10017788_22620 [Amycolatopsis acidiphila]